MNYSKLNCLYIHQHDSYIRKNNTINIEIKQILVHFHEMPENLSRIVNIKKTYILLLLCFVLYIFPYNFLYVISFLHVNYYTFLYFGNI